MPLLCKLLLVSLMSMVILSNPAICSAEEWNVGKIYEKAKHATAVDISKSSDYRKASISARELIERDVLRQNIVRIYNESLTEYQSWLDKIIDMFIDDFTSYFRDYSSIPKYHRKELARRFKGELLIYMATNEGWFKELYDQFSDYDCYSNCFKEVKSAFKSHLLTGRYDEPDYQMFREMEDVKTIVGKQLKQETGTNGRLNADSSYYSPTKFLYLIDIAHWY